jgi:hypothetical protein
MRGMRPYVCLIQLVLAACNTEPNPGVCCTTDADCAQLGGIQPRGCPDGYACRNLQCAAADCAAVADCSVKQPVCDLDSASCTGCTASSDCNGYADAQVCDAATGGCRACLLDAECASEVCDIDTGRCVAERDVIYASPGGTDTAGCTHQQPCSVARAIVVASADPSSSLVRLLPGTYSTPVTFKSGVVEVIGTGATLMMLTNAVEARESAVVEIRGFDIHGYVVSTSTTSLFPSLAVRDSTIRDGFTAIVAHGILRMLRSSIITASTAVTILDDGTFEADQSRFEGADTGGYISTTGHRMRVRITNSVLERTQLLMNNVDDAPDKSEYHVSFSTLIFDAQAQTQTCPDPGTHSRTTLFENNIFFASSAQVQSVISGFYCTLAGNITHPQDPDLGGTNIDRDPQFVDLQAKDYRLQPGSPAVDAAVSSSGPGLDHDFAGTPRPQGARKDIGAFELDARAVSPSR